MPVEISDIDLLKQYLEGVTGRATHHAGKVNNIILALAGAVVLFHDRGTPLQARTREGELVNVLHLTINNSVYVLKYNHEAESIELRRNNQNGVIVASFTNSTEPQEITNVFSQL